MPRSALGSWPVMSQLMVVGADSEVCSKVTWPETLESPRMTATAAEEKSVGWLNGQTASMQSGMDADKSEGTPPLQSCASRGGGLGLRLTSFNHFDGLIDVEREVMDKSIRRDGS